MYFDNKEKIIKTQELLQEFEDKIVESERTRHLIEIRKLNKAIKVLISALRYERGVGDVIDFIDSLPDFQWKQSDINKIMLFIDKKIIEGEEKW